MERSESPVHLHVGGKTPVYVHLKPKKKGPSNSGSYGKTRSSRYWGKGTSSTNDNPWVPPPGRSSTCNSSTIAWEGPTHRLEITPRGKGGGAGDSTLLRLSDLSDAPTDVVIERAKSSQVPVTSELLSLRAEVDQLKTEVDLERSLRDLEDTENALKVSHLTLKNKDVELARCKDELKYKELENVRLCLDKVKPYQTTPRPISESRQRENLCKKMLELDVASTSLYEQADCFVAAIKKLQKDRRFQSEYASNVTEQKDLLINQLLAFQCNNKTLRKTLRAQQAQESSRAQLSDQLDDLIGQVTQADATNEQLQSRLKESEKLSLHTQILHDEIEQKDGEIQELAAKIESLEEQLRTKSNDCIRLESSLAESKCKSQLDKSLLKKAAKLHMERAIEGEHTAETLGTKLDVANGELDKLKGKLSKSISDEMADKAEIRSLRSKVRELQDALDRSKVSCQSSVKVVSTRLLEKTQELNSAQMESDHLKSTVSSLEGKVRAIENTGQAKTASLEAEVAELRSTTNQYKSLTQEYKGQAESAHLAFEAKSRELHHLGKELERARQEGAVETEKTKLICQQHLSELESTKDLLKANETHLKETSDRMLSYEQQVSEQTKLIAELNSNLEETNSAIDTVRNKLHDSTSDNISMSTLMEVQETRLQEIEQQNRELMEIAGKRDSAIHKLQAKTEELLCELTSITTKRDTSKSDHQRQLDQLKDRAANKDRINLGRIAELETQLSKANNQAVQLRKSKEDYERRCQSRIHDIEIRLEQANSSKRSMENYANFLKTSYASVFNDVNGGTSTGPHFPSSFQ